MEFSALLETLQDEVVFESGLLLAGDVKPNDIHRKLSRWVGQGRIYQLRRGLYALAPPYQKQQPHPFYVANRIVRGSYVSAQSALAYYDLIPEYVPSVVSISAGRPNTWSTALGSFMFRHIKSEYIVGFEWIELGDGQSALIANPEKALLDLIYLTPKSNSKGFMLELRLQNLDTLNKVRLRKSAEIFQRPKMDQAVEVIEAMLEARVEEYSRESPA
jgi:hypothetical protein